MKTNTTGNTLGELLKDVRTFLCAVHSFVECGEGWNEADYKTFYDLKDRLDAALQPVDKSGTSARLSPKS